MKEIFLILLILSIESSCFGKDFVFSITGQVGYDRGTWESGVTKDADPSHLPVLVHPSRTGIHHNNIPTFGGSIQVIYDRWDFKGWKPTLDFTYRHGLFDFTGVQASEYSAKQDVYSFRIGLTKEIFNLDAYVLAGYSLSHVRPCLVEIIEGKPFDHDHDRNIITQDGLSAKVGIYKLFGNKIKFGPEVSVEFYPTKLYFRRSGEFYTHTAVPYVGVRFQY